MNIRHATPEDAEALLGIYSHYVKNTAVTFEYEVPSAEEFRMRIANTLKKYPYLVAEEDGKAVGYAYASPFKTRAAYDHSVEASIYVSRDQRRTGIGSLLLDTLEADLKKMNIFNVNACISVPDGEEDEYLTFDSVRFHEKKGYSLVGMFHKCGYKFGRWYNMVWMEKMVGEHVSPAPDVVPFPMLK